MTECTLRLPKAWLPVFLQCLNGTFVIAEILSYEGNKVSLTSPIIGLSMPYDPLMVKPMREELTRVGFTELLTPESVDSAIAQPGTTLVVINSVCGCAAGSLRPGVALSLQHEKRPDNLVTVFAGVHLESTQYIRDTYLANHPPSSPSIALFTNGTLIGMIHRHQIEGRMPENIAKALTAAYDEYCGVPTETTTE